MTLSRVEDVDHAFELLLVIMGLVMSIFSSHPEVLVGDIPDDILFLIPLMLRLTVIPLLIMLFVWLAAKLSRNEYRQILIKIVAWMIATNYTISFLYLYFRGIGFLPGSRAEEIILSMITFVINPFFVYAVVVPSYKEMYPDATFFKSKKGFIVAYVISGVILLAILYLLSAAYF
jgi:hypothetical protein